MGSACCHAETPNKSLEHANNDSLHKTLPLLSSITTTKCLNNLEFLGSSQLNSNETNFNTPSSHNQRKLIPEEIVNHLRQRVPEMKIKSNSKEATYSSNHIEHDQFTPNFPNSADRRTFVSSVDLNSLAQGQLLSNQNIQSSKKTNDSIKNQFHNFVSPTPHQIDSLDQKILQVDRNLTDQQLMNGILDICDLPSFQNVDLIQGEEINANKFDDKNLNNQKIMKQQRTSFLRSATSALDKIEDAPQSPKLKQQINDDLRSYTSKKSNLKKLLKYEKLKKFSTLRDRNISDSEDAFTNKKVRFDFARNRSQKQKRS